MCFIIQNAAGAGHILVDLGYVYNPEVPDRVKKLRALHIGKANFQVHSWAGRMLVRIPPRKLKLLAHLPIMEYGEYPTYSQATHFWEGVEDEPFIPPSQVDWKKAIEALPEL